MRAEEFITFLAEKATSEEERSALKAGLPLGLDAAGEAVLSQILEHSFTPNHTCVTGASRTTFIKRLLITLSYLYEKSEANFLIVSPRTEYGELLRLKRMDVTVPYVRTKADLEKAKACVKELTAEYTRGAGYPKLFLVLDSLEELQGANGNGDLDEYREFFDMLAREKNVAIISGAELIKSIFSGNPGVFVGVGNCLVTTREEGRADVTYVGEDSSLSMPVALQYPDSPSVSETIIYLNALPKGGEGA